MIKEPKPTHWTGFSPYSYSGSNVKRSCEFLMVSGTLTVEEVYRE